jgi:hypothetical protein
MAFVGHVGVWACAAAGTRMPAQVDKQAAMNKRRELVVMVVSFL